MNASKVSPTIPPGNNTDTSFIKKTSKPVHTFPKLHDQVLAALADHDLTPRWVSPCNKVHDKEYSTNILGTFRCRTKTCGANTWSSGRVAIVIRGYYSSEGYNAEVFNQRCRRCKKLGFLTLNEQSYIDRVTYRLKKWADVEVEPPQYESRRGPPHEAALCEGCKRGYCQNGERAGADYL